MEIGDDLGFLHHRGEGGVLVLALEDDLRLTLRRSRCFAQLAGDRVEFPNRIAQHALAAQSFASLRVMPVCAAAFWATKVFSSSLSSPALTASPKQSASEA
jgi:hypothetical protein